MYLKAQFPPLLRLWPWVWQPSVDRTKLPLRPKSPQSSVIDQNTPLSHQPSEHSSSSLSGVFRQIRFQVLTHISNGFFVSEYGIKNCTNIVLEILGCVSSWEKLVSHRIEAVGWWTENFVRNSKQMISSVVAGAPLLRGFVIWLRLQPPQLQWYAAKSGYLHHGSLRPRAMWRG